MTYSSFFTSYEPRATAAANLLLANTISPPTDSGNRVTIIAKIIINPNEESVIIHAHMTLVEPAVDGVQIAEENSLSNHIHEIILDERNVVVEEISNNGRITTC